MYDASFDDPRPPRSPRGERLGRHALKIERETPEDTSGLIGRSWELLSTHIGAMLGYPFMINLLMSAVHCAMLSVRCWSGTR